MSNEYNNTVNKIKIEISKHEAAMRDIAAISDLMSDDAAEELAMIEEEAAFQADLAEGSVESLRRARERFNNLMNRMIDKAMSRSA